MKRYLDINTDVVKELLKGLGRDGKGVDALLSVRFSRHKGKDYVGFIYDNPTPDGQKGKKTLLLPLDDARKLAKVSLGEDDLVCGIASLYSWDVPDTLQAKLPATMNAGAVIALPKRGTLMIRGLNPSGVEGEARIDSITVGEGATDEDKPLSQPEIDVINDAFAKKTWIGFMLGVTNPVQAEKDAKVATEEAEKKRVAADEARAGL